MLNLKLFQQSIMDLNNPAIATYIELIDNKQIQKPTIFSDKCNIFFDIHIPIFHTYYIRHPSLYNSYFLTDVGGFKYLSSINNNKFEFNVIVLHTVLQQLSDNISFKDSKLIKFFNIQNNDVSFQDYLRTI
jgi:hypothetical protein